jgi:hypothetical protein
MFYAISYVALGLVLGVIVFQDPSTSDAAKAAVVAAVAIVVSLCFPPLVAGVKLQQLRYYRLALAGCWVAMIIGLPCLGCLTGAGIWCFVVLMRRHVKAAFALQSQASHNPTRESPQYSSEKEAGLF